MKVAILTLGCKVNQTESAFVARGLSGKGVAIVDLSANPDYCIVNTCAVTAKSDYQSRQLVRRAVRTGAKVIVTGCYSEINAKEVRGMEGIFDVVSNINKYNIINMMGNKISSNGLLLDGRSRPGVKVQDGCDNACTYCIVPKARGESRSRDIPSILKEISEMEAAGYKEVVLTGIHLGLFGRDLRSQCRLCDLVRAVLTHTGIDRLRLSSVEVNEIDEELIEQLQDPRVCKHLHIPLQSGDDSILSLMKRKYKVSDFTYAVKAISTKVKGIAIGTDIIVGFPGEGDDEFSNTKRIVESLPLAYLHIFPFSPRPNTPACEMARQNAPSVKKERFAALNAVNIGKKEAYMKAQVGRTLDIIVEECTRGDVMLGTSSNYLKVRTIGRVRRKGSLIQVRVSGVSDGTLTADRISET